MIRQSKALSARFTPFGQLRTWAASATLSASLLAPACASDHQGDEDSAALGEALVGECTSTSQCKEMYGSDAYDCSNSGGGVCLCNPGNVWCSSLAGGTGGAASGGSCSNDAACSLGEYCNFNQGQICVDARADGSPCTRDRQCRSGSCANDTCSSSGAGEGARRIAYSADGDYADSDDWGATAVALAMLGRAGGQDSLVHFDYCSNPRSNHPQACAQSEESALGAQRRFGFDRSVFFNDDTQPQASVAHLADVVNASTAARPLYLIVAGPMDVAYRGLKAAQPSARQHVTLISHSTWNQNHTVNGSKRYIDIWNERLVGYAIVRKNNGTPGNEDLPDQNPGFKKPEAEWTWIKDSTAGSWVFGRIQAVRNPGCSVNGISVCARGDASDAGMMYFLLTGDKNGSVSKLANWWEQ